MWYAGIDWADDHHDVVMLDEHGQRVASCRVTHTPAGLAELVTFLQTQDWPSIPSIPRRWTAGGSRQEPRRMPLTRICWLRQAAVISLTYGVLLPIAH